MELVRKYKFDIAAVLFFVVLVAIFVGMRDKLGILGNRESFERFVTGFGVWAPAAVIAIIVFEVVLAPLPGFIPAISAGFIFGAFYGSVYTYTGNILGTFLVFWLSRRFGRIVVERLFGSEKLEKYEKLVACRENFLLFLYIFPVFPIDVLSGAFGLSGISFKKFAAAVSVGFVFHVLILNLFGDFLARLYFMI